MGEVKKVEKGFCRKCGSPNTKATSYKPVNYPSMYGGFRRVMRFNIKCLDCGKKWHEEFRLSDS